MTAFYLIFGYIIIVNKTRAPHLPLELGIQNNALISVMNTFTVLLDRYIVLIGTIFRILASCFFFPFTDNIVIVVVT